MVELWSYALDRESLILFQGLCIMQSQNNQEATGDSTTVAMQMSKLSSVAFSDWTVVEKSEVPLQLLDKKFRI